jgi:hypothetical protein
MIDFVHITPFCISVHLKNGTVDEFRIVAYPQFGMVHFIGPKGEYPIAPYALYTSMPEDELVEMIELRVRAFYQNLRREEQKTSAPRSSEKLFNRLEYGEE